jgi:16S rRNA (uracil1498-N3)-methyltransferase
MRHTRIFQPGSYQTGDHVRLSESASHHLAVVLRARVGDDLDLFPGDQQEFKAQISEIKKRQVTVLVGTAIHNQRESPLQIHLGQAVCKGDKMDWILQKGTELGVHAFTPILTSRSAHELSDPTRREKKLNHWQGVITHATEQCGRSQLPILHPPKMIDQFLAACNAEHQWILSPTAITPIRKCIPPEKSITVLVGPEGGWSELELLSATQSNFLPITLGPRILRTESAPIAIISILQFMAGDF